MKISKYAPTAPPRVIAKSETERLCALMFSIILQNFNMVGHVTREEIVKTELLTDGWTDGRTHDPFYKVISRR